MNRLLTKEIDARTIIDQQLKNLGWEDDPYSPEKTVWKEGVKTEKQKKALCGKKPDYVLYKKRSNIPLAVIEAKAQGKNIHIALEQGIQYAKKIGAPMVFATDGVFTKSFHIICNDSLFLNDEEIHELINYDLTIKYLSNSNLSTLTKKVQKSRGELISVFSKANDLLREEGLQAGIERFSEFSTLLFLKIFSEMEQIRLEKGIKGRTKNDFLWDSFKNETGNKLLSYVNDTVIQWFANEYEKDVFQKLSIKNPDNLKEIIDLISELQLTDTDVDIKGDAFEYFIRAYSASNPSDLGEIFTPRHIVKTMVKLLNPKIDETIYDPFCGTGGMLIVAFKHIRESMIPTDRNMKILKKETLYGTELTKTAKIAKMNMILADDGHSNIIQGDSFQNPVDPIYDIVITNYPFAQKTRYGDLYPIPSRNGDVIAPQHCFQALKEGGRMAFIAPEGFLFRQDRALRDVRKFLLENANLKSIISLPQGCFLPYNGVKASILYFDEVRRSKTKEYFFFYDVKNDGFTLDKRRTKIEGANDLDNVLSERNLEKADDDHLKNLGVSKIKLKDVEGSNYNLACRQYINNIPSKPSKYPMVELGEVCEFKSGLWEGKKEPFEKVKIIRNTNFTKSGEIDTSNIATHNVEYKQLINKRLEFGDIILENSGGGPKQPVGRVVFFDIKESNKYSFSNFTTRIRAFEEKIKHKYLFYILRHIYQIGKTENLQRQTSGIRNLDKKAYAKIKIPLPPIDFQKELVKELDGYQKIIDGCRQVIENYKPIIEIDPSWEMVELGEVADFKRGPFGGSLKKEIFVPNGNLVYEQYHAINNDFSFERYFIDDEKFKEMKSFQVKSGDIIISCSGTMGKMAIVPADFKRGVINQALLRLRTIKKSAIKEFIKFYLESDLIQDKFFRNQSGSAIQNVASVKHLKTIPFPKISISEQMQISKKIEKEIEAVDCCKWLIEIYNQKIQDKINKLYNDDGK